MLRVLPMAVADLVAESFETDALRAALAWRGVRYGAVGPWSAGTAAMLLGDAAGNDGGAAGETVFAKGGPGALSEALAAAARAAGATIRTSAAVARITSRDGRATGVVLEDGEEIQARRGRLRRSTRSGRSSTSSTPWRSGRRSAGGPATSGRRASSPRSTSRSGSCRSSPPPAATRRCCAAGSSSRPGIDAMERAFDATKYGRWSERPILEATIPSLADPSLVEGAKAGTHVMSVIAQYAPYELARRRLGASQREAFGDAVIAVARVRGAGHRQARHRTARSSRRSTSSASSG